MIDRLEKRRANLRARPETVRDASSPRAARVGAWRRRAAAAMLALLAAGCASAPASGPRPDFTGRWVLDRALSDLPTPRQPDGYTGPLGIPEVDVVEVSDVSGDRAGGAAFHLVVDHRDPVLRIERVVERSTGTRTSPVVLYTDGREAENAGTRGDVVVSRSTWEGDVLVTRSERTFRTPRGRSRRVAVEERRRLAAGGARLVVEMRIGRLRSTRLVFVREEAAHR